MSGKWAIGAALGTAGSLCMGSGVWASMAEPWQMGMQKPASPTMSLIVGLNDFLTIIITGIVLLVTGLLLYVMWRFRASKNPEPANWSHNTPLEIAWTAIPALILLVVAFPSFHLLYFMDRTAEPDLTLKVVGHQWYWSYEYPDHQIGFDAVMLNDDELKPGQPRLLSTDNHVVVPVGAKVKVLLTADDVLHSWAVPALGIKTDTIPGRLNETWFQVERPGLYYGQCSELCGVNHGFMPIVVEALEPADFQKWLDTTKKKAALGSEPAGDLLARN